MPSFKKHAARSEGTIKKLHKEVKNSLVKLSFVLSIVLMQYNWNIKM